MRTVAAQMTLEEMHEQRGDYAARVQRAGRRVAGRQRARAGERRHRRPRPDQPRIFRPVQRLRRRGPDPAHRIDRDAPQDAQRDRAAHAGRDPQPEPGNPAPVFEIDRDTEYARLEQEREVEVAPGRAARRARQGAGAARPGGRAGAAGRRARRSRSRGSRRSANITEERIRNEEDTQRREIARRRALDESRAQDAREDRARADRARAGARDRRGSSASAASASWRSCVSRRLEVAELERQIALAEKALSVTKAEAERRRAEIVANQETEASAHCPGPAARRGAARARAASGGAADRQAPGIRGGRDRRSRGGRARPHRDRARPR